MESSSENNYSQISLLLFKDISYVNIGKAILLSRYYRKSNEPLSSPLLTTPCHPRAVVCSHQCRCTSAVIRHLLAPYWWTWLAYYVAPSRSCHPFAASSHICLSQSHTQRVVYLKMKCLLITTVKMWGDVAGTSNQT